MDNLKAFAMGMANRHKEQMVFDWNKAASLIKTHRPSVAIAGLSGDMEYTSDIIYFLEKPVKNADIYLASTWAVPVCVIDGTAFECYKMEHEVPKWGAKTIWPKSALNILKGEKNMKTITKEEFDKAVEQVTHELIDDPRLNGMSALLIPLTGMTFAGKMKDILFGEREGE